MVYDWTGISLWIACPSTRTPCEAFRSWSLPQEWLKELWFGLKKLLETWTLRVGYTELNRIVFLTSDDFWLYHAYFRWLWFSMTCILPFLWISGFQAHVFFMMLQAFWPLTLTWFKDDFDTLLLFSFLVLSRSSSIGKCPTLLSACQHS